MTDLYLIAHKVRSTATFDIATQMECSECMDLGGCNYGCTECDQLGYWWIIPTSGHRAYPYHHAILSEDSALILEAMPPDLPDHYAHTTAPRISLAEALGLTRPKPPAPAAPFPRRL